MSRQHYNFQTGQLGVALSATSGSQAITNFFATVPSFPTIASPDYVALAVDQEIMWLTAYTPGSRNATVTRGQEGTSPAAHAGPPSAATWQHGPTALDTVDPNAGDLAAVSFGASASAGSVGIAADAGHVHPAPALDATASDIQPVAASAAAGGTGKAPDAGHVHVGVTSFNGRQGVVAPASGDYSVGQITGAAPLASPAFTGSPTAPTASPFADSTILATTAYVDALWRGGIGIYSAAEYGVVPSSADISTDLNNLISTVGAAGGGLILLPAGTLHTNASILVNNNHVHILGMGRGATVIQTTNASFDVFQVGTAAQQDNCEIGGMTITDSGTKSGGYAVHPYQAYALSVHDLYLTGQYSGLGVGNGTGTGGVIKSRFFRIDAAYWASASGHGIDYDNQNGVDVWFANITSNDSYTSTKLAYFVNIVSGGGSYWYEVGDQESTVGWNIAPGSGRTITAAHFFTRCGADTNASQGLYIGGGSGLFFTSCWFSTVTSSSGHNVQIAAGSDIFMDGTMMMNSTGGGILIQSSGGVQVRNSYITGCSGTGIEVAAAAGNLSLLGNYSSYNGSGIIVDAGASNNYIVSGNLCIGNTTTALSDGGTGANKYVAGNVT